jgi:hypothetical protein
MKTLNLIKLTVVTGTLLTITLNTHAGIAYDKGSSTPSQNPHNFYNQSWNTDPSDPGAVCTVCHTPHHADASAGPLWGHTMSGNTYKMYGAAPISPGSTIKATIDPAPAASSLACLSCHDGTVALNAYGGRIGSGATLAGTVYQIAEGGTDLSHSHPISFVYDSTLWGLDKGLNNPSSSVLTPASDPNFQFGADMSINGFLLGGKNRLECSSCHDVHNQEGSPWNLVTNPKLLRINGVDQNGVGSLLCRSCHNK